MEFAPGDDIHSAMNTERKRPMKLLILYVIAFVMVISFIIYSVWP